jgi:mono/diheme cytochrome c family protein
MRTILGHFIGSRTAPGARWRLRLGACAAAMFAIAVSGCGPSKPMTPAQKGRIAYMTTCIACHNPNPNLAGPKGPPIAGSPRELIYDRVMFLKYPPGYKPKRTTHNMRAQPQMANRIDDLTAFLAEAAKKQ